LLILLSKIDVTGILGGSYLSSQAVRGPPLSINCQKIACTLLLQAIVNDEQEFNWDDANVGHLARHEVLPFEAEEAILDPHTILLESRPATRNE
jgi:hypothetical protein